MLVRVETICFIMCDDQLNIEYLFKFDVNIMKNISLKVHTGQQFPRKSYIGLHVYKRLTRVRASFSFPLTNFAFLVLREL